MLAASLLAAGGCGAPDEPATTAWSATSGTAGVGTTTAPAGPTTTPPTTPPTTTRPAPTTTTSPPRTTTPAPRAEPVRVQPAAAPAPEPAAAPEPVAEPEPEPEPKPARAAGGCNDNYDPCVPDDPDDVDCEGGSGNGPSYVDGPVRVTGTDVYGLDRDDDGVGCE